MKIYPKNIIFMNIFRSIYIFDNDNYALSQWTNNEYIFIYMTKNEIYDLLTLKKKYIDFFQNKQIYNLSILFEANSTNFLTKLTIYKKKEQLSIKTINFLKNINFNDIDFNNIIKIEKLKMKLKNEIRYKKINRMLNK